MSPELDMELELELMFKSVTRAMLELELLFKCVTRARARAVF